MKHISVNTLIMSEDIVFTHLLLLGPSVMLFGVEIFTACPLPVGVFWKSVCNVSEFLTEL